MIFSVFRNINRFANKSKILDTLAIFCAKYLLYLMLLSLAVLAYAHNNWRIFFYPLLSGLFAAFVINKTIYIFYKKQRPAYSKNAKVLISIPGNPSFPSRHASLIFGVSFYLFFYSAPLATVFIICACLIGISRVFCGVHWFRDILAGIFIGFMSALMIHSLLNYIRY